MDNWFDNADETEKDVIADALGAAEDLDLRVPCFCEENVWRLACRKLLACQESEDFYVVFISNAKKVVPMAYQRAAAEISQICCWDYHVVLFGVNPTSRHCRVYDIDSKLTPYPCHLTDYLLHSFPRTTRTQHLPFFRILAAKHFVSNFASNRMHMYDKHSQTWNAEPPSYPCIKPERSNLDRFLDFQSEKSGHAESEYGNIYTISQVKDLVFVSDESCHKIDQTLL